MQLSFDINAIQSLTKATGGAFFDYVGKKDLPHIFSQIRDDTRGQYLLTYISPADKSRAELDDLRRRAAAAIDHRKRPAAITRTSHSSIAPSGSATRAP